MVKLIELLLSFFFPKQKDNSVVISQPISFIPKENALIKTEELKVPASKPAKHTNDGNCQKCELIFNRYPGFHKGLKDWFKQIQANHPEAHISAAGRGKLEQEEYFKKGSSKAKYGQSSHNVGCAIDIFKLHDNGAEWPKDWFNIIINSAVDSHNAAADFKIKWYGKPGSSFYELPHCEIENWKELFKSGKVQLVEPL